MHLYGIPYKFYRKYGIQIWFHTSTLCFRTCGTIFKADTSGFKVIVCHLGNGSSISAVQDGKCVDTTMGLTLKF